MKFVKLYLIVGFLLFGSVYRLQAQKASVLDSVVNKILLSKSDKKSKADLLLESGAHYYFAGDYKVSLDLLRYAQQIYDLLGDSIGKAKAYVQIGNIYSEISDYTNSVGFYSEAMRILQNTPNNDLAILVLGSVAKLNIEFENYTKALKLLLLQKSLCMKDSIKYKAELAKNLLTIGVVHSRTTNIDSALVYYNKALQKGNMKDNPGFTAGVYINMGAVNSLINNYDIAREYYNKAFVIFKANNLKIGLGVTYGNLAYLLQKEKKYKEAVPLYEKAIEYFKQANDLKRLNEAYINLSDAYGLMGDYSKAYKYLYDYVDLLDSINSADVVGKVTELEMQYEIKKKDQELKIMEQQKLIAEKEIQYKKIRSIFLWLTIILLLTAGGLFIRNLSVSLKNINLKQQLLENEKHQLSNELTYKNKELENFALRIVEKNELLEELKKEISKVSAKEEDVTKLTSISHSIRQNLQLDKDTQELEMQINKVHQNFLFKLDQKHPDLTKSEKRLCSLLVLDLSSKDISTIMNISPESVKKGRHRLRKKLSIETEEDIAKYLKNL